MTFQDGLHLVVKRDCPTCTLIEPAIREIASSEFLTIYVQDDPDYLGDLEGQRDDTSLETSFKLNIETVPSILSITNGNETSRAVGWHRSEWQNLTGNSSLGNELPELQPGCGSKSIEPGVAEVLRVKFGNTGIKSRSISPAPYEDEHELCFDRGWSDGLPIIPPTPERIIRMFF